jgi:hypothetical protein
MRLHHPSTNMLWQTGSVVDGLPERFQIILRAFHICGRDKFSKNKGIRRPGSSESSVAIQFQSDRCANPLLGPTSAPMWGGGSPDSRLYHRPASDWTHLCSIFCRPHHDIMTSTNLRRFGREVGEVSALVFSLKDRQRSKGAARAAMDCCCFVGLSGIGLGRLARLTCISGTL